MLLIIFILRFGMKIQTERLMLRQLLAKDAQEFFLLRTDEQINKFISRQIPESIDDAIEFIKNINEGITNKQWLYWTIILKENESSLI